MSERLSDQDRRDAQELGDRFKIALAAVAERFIADADAPARLVMCSIAAECLLLAATMHRASFATEESFVDMARDARDAVKEGARHAQ